MLFGELTAEAEVPAYKSAEEMGLSTHFESDKIIDEITNNIGGFSWEVDFYNQLITLNDASTSLDVNLTPAVQRYRKIESLEIKLQSSISNIAVSDIKGEATINIGSAIYINDVFTAKMRDNRIGLFKIDNVTSNTYELNQIVVIEFSIFGFADTEHDLYLNLLSKVDTVYVHDIGFKKHNGSPIIAKKEYMNHSSIIVNCKILITNYLSKFLDTTKNLIVLKIEDDFLVDPFLNDFILSVFSSSDIPLLSRVSRIESNGNRRDTSTLYNSILGYLDLKYANKLYFNTTVNDPYLKNYLNIKYSVGLNNEDLNLVDKPYFITPDFYDQNGDTSPMSDFDTVLIKFIEGKELSPLDAIKTVIDDTLTETDFDIYFKLPILVMIYRQTSYSFKG